MHSLYYISMLAGVTWLCIWCALPEEMRRRLWSPFDMREETAPPPSAPRAGGPQGWRARAAAEAARRRAPRAATRSARGGR